MDGGRAGLGARHGCSTGAWGGATATVGLSGTMMVPWGFWGSAGGRIGWAAICGATGWSRLGAPNGFTAIKLPQASAANSIAAAERRCSVSRICRLCRAIATKSMVARAGANSRAGWVAARVPPAPGGRCPSGRRAGKGVAAVASATRTRPVTGGRRGVDRGVNGFERASGVRVALGLGSAGAANATLCVLAAGNDWHAWRAV